MLAQAFLTLHRAYQNATDQLLSLSGTAHGGRTDPRGLARGGGAQFLPSPPQPFRELEEAASTFWGDTPIETDEVYSLIKHRLRQRLGIAVRVVPVAELPNTLRRHDEARREILLSEALDHPNRTFQLVHVAGLIEQRALFDTLLARSGISDPRGQARCRVELANYFAAAVLMPYDAYLSEARASKYDVDHLATRFGVSFEQACHRATTLQREGAQGVPSSSCASTRPGT